MHYQFIDPAEVLDGDAFAFVERFLTRTKRWEIGWHYVADLSWIVSQAKNWPAGSQVLDAGGGHGPLQFLLAEMGFHVTNVDLKLPFPQRAYLNRYGLSVAQLASYQPTDYVEHLQGLAGVRRVKRFLTESRVSNFVLDKQYAKRHENWRQDEAAVRDTPVGSLRWVEGNLCECPEIESNSFDAIVSLSSIEHIPASSLAPAVAELKRLAKEDASWAVTTSATDQRNGWFHEPSRGWCFSEAELTKLFDAAAAPAQKKAAEILSAYKASDYLKDHLAKFYFRSGENGMPWGKWDPHYIPVGLYK